MKKIYENPSVEVIELALTDVIVCSGGTDGDGDINIGGNTL